MARATGISVQNTFVKGLITEAGPLAFPENACVDAVNCVFDNLGSVEVRPGFTFEDNFVEVAETMSGKAITTFLWENVSEEGDLSFVVKQIGDALYFYTVTSNASLSASKHTFEIDLTDYSSTGGSVQTLECQFSSGGGRLFVTGQRLDTFSVSYSISTDTFTVLPIDVQIRDLKGDTADPFYSNPGLRQTGTLADVHTSHRYNLYNQGWTNESLTSWDVNWSVNEMPSNADVPWYFKDANNQLDFTTVNDHIVGNSPAPRGHFIYNVYNQVRSNNVPGATDDQILPNRLATSAYFAGRVFYSGFYAEGHTSKIYFSQIITEPTQYGKCYQINDPTSEKLFDLLPSDGGVIDLLEAGTVVKMIPVSNALIVWATNGIWAITGSQGTGFTATDYSVVKLSSNRQNTHTSFVLVEGTPYWWNIEGIYRLGQDQGNLKVESITDTTIKTFYRSILNDSKDLARGVYDPSNKRIIWLYRSSPPSQFSDKYIFDRILVFNLLTGSFSPWQMGTDIAKLHSAVCVKGVGGVFENVNVISDGDNVVSDGNNVIIFQARSETINSIVKYVASDNAGDAISFAELRDETNYKDWVYVGSEGQDYDSYFISGYALRGEGARKQQTNYLNIFSKSEQDSMFKVRGLWNYAISGNSGKWSTSQTYTIPAGDFSIIRKRPKIRGHGFVCQYKIEKVENNPFFIVGWSAAETANKWV